jgi:hypothetical protein
VTGAAPLIHVSLGTLRGMKDLPTAWQALVEESVDLPDETAVAVTEERAEIVPRDLI